MATMFVRHRVKDFGAWKRAYDDFRETQRRLGVTSETVYQALGDANDVTVTHEFATAHAAEAFVQSQELRDAMAAAGVVGEPTIWFTDRV